MRNKKEEEELMREVNAAAVLQNTFLLCLLNNLMKALRNESDAVERIWFEGY